MAEVAETVSCTPPDRRPEAVGRRPRRLRVLLAGLAAGTPLLTGLGAAPASAAVPVEVTPDSQLTTVSITDVSPASPGSDDTVTVRGTVTNNGDTAILDGSVAARTGVELTSRSAIEDALRRDGFTDRTVDGSIVDDYAQELGTVDPGLSATFALDVPVEELELGEDGVYQIGVTLTGQTEAERWDHIYGMGRTLLPWQQGGADSGRTGLTVLWPLISTTHLTAETGPDDEQTPAFRDDSLLQEISPGGRLDQLVELGANLPVTWVIDPDLLASVEAMTEGYQIDTPGGAVNGEGQEEAGAFLQRLREVVRDEEVVALPFADPDIAALAHRGQEVRGALGHLRDATVMAGDTVQAILDVEARTDFTWPVEGAIDPEIVSVGTSAGADKIIARSDSLRAPDSLVYTPSAPRPLGDDITAVVADARLSTLFEGDMASGAAASLATQQLLAQTLSITQQEPANERNILLAPQRMPSARQAQAMADAVTTLQQDGSWVRFAPLSETATAEADPALSPDVPSAADYPQSLRDQELPTSAFQAMRQTQRALDEFAVILTQRDRVETPYGNAIRREMSTSWRGEAQAASEYRASVQNGLEELRSQVRIIQKTPIMLSGRSATIPITIQNNLVQDIEGLELRLTSTRRFGLEVSAPQEISVSGGHSQSVKFSTIARANGKTTIHARLYTADNKPYGETMAFQADVNSITSTVMMVIAGGLLLVVLAGIRMYSQRKRASRISEAEEAGGEVTGTDRPDADGPADGHSGHGQDTDAEPTPGDPVPEPPDRQDGGAGEQGRGTADGEPPGAVPPREDPAGEPDNDTGGDSTGTPAKGERLDDDQ
ncbi:DUF6049 family protein [Streptomyces avicenniae]|uniref:DUF6049 family protein n=1 Tax=Streptomyces avicenniae TaxID=500153 RepID=UPI00167DCED2|nr:DUF6049 family protein [Streptomyces avicenniae]